MEGMEEDIRREDGSGEHGGVVEDVAVGRSSWKAGIVRWRSVGLAGRVVLHVVACLAFALRQT